MTPECQCWETALWNVHSALKEVVGSFSFFFRSKFHDKEEEKWPIQTDRLCSQVHKVHSQKYFLKAYQSKHSSSALFPWQNAVRVYLDQGATPCFISCWRASRDGKSAASSPGPLYKLKPCYGWESFAQWCSPLMSSQSNPFFHCLHLFIIPL